MELATSVSTTSRAVAGGEVSMALLIVTSYELFGFLGGPRIDVTQQPVQ